MEKILSTLWHLGQTRAKPETNIFFLPELRGKLECLNWGKRIIMCLNFLLNNKYLPEHQR